MTNSTDQISAIMDLKLNHNVNSSQNLQPTSTSKKPYENLKIFF